MRPANFAAKTDVYCVTEDNLKEKMEAQLKGNHIVCSEVLEEIMEESIRIFWEFVKADKDETPWMLKGLLGTHVQLQDPSDFKFMANVQSNLQKVDDGLHLVWSFCPSFHCKENKEKTSKNKVHALCIN